MPDAPGNLEQFAAKLKELSEKVAAEEPAQLSPARARTVRATIGRVHETLGRVMEILDPIKHPGFIFDPSNPNVAGRIAAIAMLAQPRKPLENIERFYGAGVYAIYYNGDYEAYQGISKHEHPIYVGKADPASPGSKTAIEQGPRLAARLTDHRRNIAKANSTLKLEDFEYRALVVQSGWQDSAENYLIHIFEPIWNNEVGICYGFGKHGDDPTTRANLRSPWDTLHPGRDWAHRDPNMKDARPLSTILEDIKLHLAQHPPIESIDEILRKFLDEMREVS